VAGMGSVTKIPTLREAQGGLQAKAAKAGHPHVHRLGHCGDTLTILKMGIDGYFSFFERGFLLVS